ncbi:M48 family metallopeptidase, partial [Acidiphilium sp. PM]|uniref:tetratricopeptide repeat protein n=1 Tax=Acidiphilium sp. PM TaxID=1043206 RepID=UPI00110FCEB3
QSQPYIVRSAQWQLLHAVSDIVSFHPNKALKHLQKMPKSEDQANFWRGVADAEIYNNQNSGNILRKYINFLSALPVALRGQVTPIVGEALIRTGKVHALEQLFQLFPNEKYLRLEKAELQEKLGDNRNALISYHNIIKSKNNRDSAIAFSRMIMLEYKLHKIDAKSAASLLLSHIYDWRGEHHELSLRLHLAQLQAAYGAWPEAMAGLNRALILFPNEADSINGLRQKFFTKLENDDILKKMSPLAAAALIEDNMDLIPGSSLGMPVLKILSSKLLDLGLKHPSEKILNTIIKTAKNDREKFELSIDLAKFQIRQNNLDSAQIILNRINKPPLSFDQKRIIDKLNNEIETMKNKHVDEKIFIGEKHKNSELKKIIIDADRKKDWKTEEHALSALARLQIPKSGMLSNSEAQIAVNLAFTASKMHDISKINEIKNDYINRIPAGPQSALFMVITDPPISKKGNLQDAIRKIKNLESVVGDKKK